MTTVQQLTRDSCPVFDDDEVRYSQWKSTVMIYILNEDALDLLNGTVTAITPPDKTNKTLVDIYNKNNRLYSSLLATTSGRANIIVMNSKTAALPYGSFHEAWKNLEGEYAPNDAAVQMLKTVEFQDCGLKTAAEDPQDWFTRIEVLRNELQTLGINKTQDDCISVVLTKLPTEIYGVLKTQLYFELKTKSLTWSLLKDQVKNQYKEWKNSSVQNPTYQLMVHQGNNGPKYCTFCRRRGHTVENCWKKPGNEKLYQDYLSKITCHLCKQKGHIARNCPNKNSQQTYQTTDNRNNAMTMNNNNYSNNQDNQQEQGMFVGALITYEKEQAPEDTCQWLLDTGAECHVCNNFDLFSNIRPAMKVIYCVDTSKPVQAPLVGQVIIKNNNGQILHLDEVYYGPKFQCNIISLSCLMKDGFTEVMTSENGVETRNPTTYDKFYFTEREEKMPSPLFYFTDLHEDLHYTSWTEEEGTYIRQEYNGVWEDYPNQTGLEVVPFLNHLERVKRNKDEDEREQGRKRTNEQIMMIQEVDDNVRQRTETSREEDTGG